MKIARYQTDEIPSDKIEPLIKDSFFASAGFLDLWRQVGGRPVIWVASHGENIQAALPGLEFGRGPFRRFHALPDGCYGRMFGVSENGADNEVVASLLTQEIARAGYVKANIFDFHSSLSNVIGFKTEEFTTWLVDIDNKDWLPPDKTLQSELRKAEREGVSFGPFDYERHFKRFIALMRQTEARHGRKPKYPPKFFAALARLAETDSRVVWWWCEHEGEAVSSHINIVEGSMVLNWQVYYDKAFSYLKANQHMLYQLAREQSTKGIRRLNLGASPPDAENLEEYKSKWGGRPYTYRCYFRRAGLGKYL